MLKPDTTTLLTDALQPPPGYDVDVAVTTTYSLNLTAMLIAPMTFALAGIQDTSDMARRDPAQLLDAVQRYMGRTTVFCQAAGIHVPTTHSRIHTFLEGSIHQVEPPREHALFHPKLWAVRYRGSADDSFLHRVVVASRNLTLDSSWDTALILEESRHGTIDARPAADTIAALPGMILDPMTQERHDSILDLATTLREVHLEAPPPFTGGTLLPLGLDDDSPWPFPARAKKTLAISPFLNTGTLARLRAGTADATLLTRADSADQLGAAATADWDVHVLDAAADYDHTDGGAAESELGVITADDDVAAHHVELTGLHAKTVVLDHPGGQSSVVTGSANLTRAAWNRNVEFNATLTGPTRTCGVDAVLGRDGEDMGLRTIMEPYTPASDPFDDSEIATGHRLEEFHRALARSTPRPRLDVVPQGEDTVSARLTLVLPAESEGETTIWLPTVPAQRRPLGETTLWDLAIENITPFVAVETTAGTGAARATRRCLLKVPIIGDPLDRRQRALATLLCSRDRVLRYLALLLGFDDPTHGIAAQDFTDESMEMAVDGTGSAQPQQTPPIVLFEPLVRAVGTDIDRLASVAEQVKEVLELPNSDTLIPPEFRQMWDVVLEFSLRGRNS
ncbi:MAG TPA: phospholipase D family protein [Jiangellaceae bacterium]|nr:phospholipase D family protein [Jiangellaceae bacterium]